MFGRTMRIPDTMLADWYRLVAERPVPEGEPMAAKLELARAIVARSHGEEAARAAEDHFTRVVREGRAPDEVEEVPVADPDPVVHLPALLASALGQSSSHWRRTIDQGGVKIDARPVAGYDVPWDDLEGLTLQAGKRQFVRFVRV
jgi:tyrosyl-tRNA synthetase